MDGDLKLELTPDRPVLRGTAQNPDVYFQARESVNLFYHACPDITQKIMDRFAQLTGRQYHLYEYHGALRSDFHQINPTEAEFLLNRDGRRWRRL